MPIPIALVTQALWLLIAQKTGFDITRRSQSLEANVSDADCACRVQIISGKH